MFFPFCFPCLLFLLCYPLPSSSHLHSLITLALAFIFSSVPFPPSHFLYILFLVPPISLIRFPDLLCSLPIPCSYPVSFSNPFLFSCHSSFFNFFSFSFFLHYTFPLPFPICSFSLPLCFSFILFISKFPPLSVYLSFSLFSFSSHFLISYFLFFPFSLFLQFLSPFLYNPYISLLLK